MPGFDFGDAFEALTAEDGKGHRPFRWQRRLLDRFVDSDLPEVVDIPTGLGKTSVMALWLIALAEGANLPRRLVYVVDRRAVVDQATRFAERLRENLDAQLACRLRFREGEKLPISTLRGGFADNRDWLEDPSSPAIVVGTIDMVGSRLLFEGYGVSRSMRPYHAGFLGVDALVVLDEAHLCPPFEALLRQIAGDREGKFRPVGATADNTPPFRLMSLSATGREWSATQPFRLEMEDEQEPVVRERLMASKRLAVRECEDAKKLPECIADRAREIGCSDPSARVLVYCHSREHAVKVKELIDKATRPKSKTKDEAASHSELLVGERRVYERQNLEGWLECHGFLGGAGVPSPLNAPTFLVATSAGEVGVDLDADHMICDLVAFERMVQRLGRVNRRGGEGREARIEVFAVSEPPPEKPKSDASEKQWAKYYSECNAFKVIEAHKDTMRCLPKGADGLYNANFSGIDALKSDPNHRKIIEVATTPAPLYPALTRPHLDAWSMTSLRQHEGRPEIAPWLRGWEEQEEGPQTEVVWRTHLPLVRDGEGVTAPGSMVVRFFQCAPIHASEKLEALRSHVCDWLFRQAKSISKRPDRIRPIRDKEIIALVVNRDGELVDSAKLGDLLYWSKPAKDISNVGKRRKEEWERGLANATLIVDARMAGLQDGMLKQGCNDVVPTADGDGNWQGLREDTTDHRPIIKFRIEPLTAVEGGEGLQARESLDGWRHVHTFETEVDSGGSVRRGLAVYKWPDSSEDEDSRSILSAPQSLRDHANEVAACVRQIAQHLPLPKCEVEALEIAARFHDDGKAAARWQDAMAAPSDGRPYAKTGGGGDWRKLEGYRHEFGSLLRAEREDLPEATRELILHLIAAHHGHARPLVSHMGCEDGPPSLLEGKAGEAALRFARLQKYYGPWGLAWREAILRAADQSASRDWDRRSRQQGQRNDG